MIRQILLERVGAHGHRVLLWKRYKEIVRRHPEKYRIVYHHANWKFALETKTLFGWKPFAESQEWELGQAA